MRDDRAEGGAGDGGSGAAAGDDGAGDGGSGAAAGDDEPVDQDTGTYTLLIDLPSAATVEVGALGECHLDAGAYAYTGSAFGPGGFGRIDRHRRVAAGEHDVRHWHVDYLLSLPASRLVAIGRTPGRDVECEVARSLGDGPIPGFGASDCDCESHLAFRETIDSLRQAVGTVQDRVDVGG